MGQVGRAGDGNHQVAMAEVIKTVKVSGGDYTSITAWVAGEQRALGVDEIAVAECYKGFASDTLVDTPNITGFTGSSATRYVEIRAAPGNGHTGTPDTGIKIKSNTSGTATIRLNQPFVRIKDLEVEHSVDAASSNAFLFNSSDCRVDRCIARCNSRAVINLPVNKTGNVMTRSLFYLTAGVTTVSTVSISGTGTILDQCTIEGSVLLAAALTDTIIRNSVSTKLGLNSKNWAYTLVGGSSTKNAGSNASTNTPPGTSPLTSDLTDGVDYLSIANHNYRLPPGSRLIGAGTDLTGVVDKDIAETPLDPAYPIGCWAPPVPWASARRQTIVGLGVL